MKIRIAQINSARTLFVRWRPRLKRWTAGEIVLRSTEAGPLTRSSKAGKTVAAAAVIFAGVGFAVAARADASSSTAADALLAKASSTLASAKTLTADFEENDSYPTPYKDLAQRGTVSLSRSINSLPGGEGRGGVDFRIDIKRFRRVNAADPWKPSGNDAISVSDGKTYTYAFLHPHSTQFRSESLTDKSVDEAFRLLPTLSGFFGGAAFDHPAGSASLLPGEQWEGTAYQVVDYPVTAGDRDFDAHAYVGDDGLVHRLVYSAETKRGVVVKEWTLRNVKIDAPVDGATFAYTPPADATPLVARSGADDLLAAGTIAPDFTVTDAHGKPVKLSDFRGKTVVLDFWATWCWPCNQSLPHTEAVVEQNQSKNVVALAVAIWDNQTGFDAWTAKHNFPDIDFAIDPSPQGKDVASALYHVSTTPTAYIIDPSGRVSGAVVGYAGPSDQLQAAINASASPTTAQAN